MISAIAQYVLAGLAIGGIYALVALGFHIMWSTANAVNFAHGDTLMGGAMAAIIFLDFGFPPYAAFPLAIGSAAIFGLIVERIAIRPFAKKGANPLGWVLTTIAIGLMIEALVTMETDGFARPLPSPGVASTISVLGANVYPQELLIPFAAIIISIALTALKKYTLFGRAMVAVSFSHDGASIVGINVNRIIAISFALAAVIGAVAGILIGPVTQVSATMGLNFGLKGFVVAIVGGITSAYGGLIMGLVLGVVEKLTEGFISTSAREIVGFMLMILILLASPQGVFGKKRIFKV